MGLEDLFEFDEAKYRKRVKTMNWSELRKREVQKYRQQYSSSAAAGGGVGLAPFTAGLSLVGTAYALRCIDIAEQKHSIVVAELKARGHPLYEPDWKDAVVPAICGVAGTYIGIGIGAAIPTDALNAAAGSFALDPNTASNLATNHSTLIAHAGDGFQGQINMLTDTTVFDGVTQAPIATPGDPAATIGTAAGYAAAQLGEAFAAGKVVSKAADKMLGTKVGSYSGQCKSAY
jgi:hypothetical protein